MKAYNYGEYVYFNNSIYAPEEHHDRLILNQKIKLYIKSLSKLMANSFTSLLKSFVDEIQKTNQFPYQSWRSVIKIHQMEKRKPTHGTNVYCKRK